MSAVLAMQRDNKSELESVRWLLREWVRWRRRWKPPLGYPGAVPYLYHIKATIDSWAEPDDYDEKIELIQMQALDKAIQSLSREHRHALHVYYLREDGPEVWRSARLPMKELRRLAAEAQEALVPILRRLNILL